MELTWSAVGIMRRLLSGVTLVGVGRPLLWYEYSPSTLAPWHHEFSLTRSEMND